MQPDILLLEPHTLSLIRRGQCQLVDTLEEPLSRHVLLLDGFGESFVQESWPDLRWYEKKTFARNRLRALFSQNNVHLVKSHPRAWQGASAALDVCRNRYAALNVQDQLLGVGFLACEVAKTFELPTALVLQLPSGQTRFFYCQKGAPLFARTLDADPAAQQEDMKATLYHLERHFQTPQEKIQIVSWVLQELMEVFKERPPGTLAFESPFQKSCTKTRQRTWGAVMAPVVSLGLLGLTSFQGVELFEMLQAQERADLTLTNLQTQKATLPPLSQTDRGLRTMLAAYEDVKKKPSPLHVLQALAPLNTRAHKVSGLSWKAASHQGASELRVQVCARTSQTPHALEKGVLQALSGRVGAPRLRLAQESTVVFQEETSLGTPCLLLETGSVP